MSYEFFRSTKFLCEFELWVMSFSGQRNFFASYELWVMSFSGQRNFFASLSIMSFSGLKFFFASYECYEIFRSTKFLCEFECNDWNQFDERTRHGRLRPGAQSHQVFLPIDFYCFTLQSHQVFLPIDFYCFTCVTRFYFKLIFQFTFTLHVVFQRAPFIVIAASVIIWLMWSNSMKNLLTLYLYVFY
jgi:hypothetical protein